MELMWTNVTFLVILILFEQIIVSKEQVCKISNVQIENEDGRQNFIELNLKRLDNDDKSSCPGCNLSDDSKAGGYHYSQWIATPPSFHIIFSPGELFAECESDGHDSLPAGLCSKAKLACLNDVCDLEEIEELAEIIRESDLSSQIMGHGKLDKRVAIAIVHLNLGNLDKAIEDFTAILDTDLKAVMAYFGRGAAYARKGLRDPSTAHKALDDFTSAIEYDKNHQLPNIFIQRAQTYMMLHKYSEAYSDATKALQVKTVPKVFFLRGVSSLMLELFEEAEADFRRNLVDCGDKHIQTLSHFHLGLALYYRGKIRNAVEVFKEVLKENPDHLEASLSLAQGFKELGNLRAAMSRFNQTAEAYPNQAMIYKLRGNLFFDSGDPKSALLDFERCIELDKNNAHCRYMASVSKVSLGQFYSGIKDATKVMVTNIPSIKASPEFIKAHYLREYARYVHTHLDSPILSMQLEVDMSPEYLDHWVKLKPFDYSNYKEQPGLQPDIQEVDELISIPSNLKALLCRAEELGRLSQVSVDGILPNRRINLAMGLAAIHTAQVLEMKWKALKTLSKTNNSDKVMHSWRELFYPAVAYRRLASLDEPFIWVDSLPDYKSKEGYRADIPFVRGSVTNIKVTPYYELAFKLAKTMLEHYSGEGAVAYPGLREDIQKANNCEDLLNVARRRQINPHGVLVSTQVPSLLRVKDDYRLDGGVLVLTEDLSSKTVFALNVANTPDRTSSYSAEMDLLLILLQDEMKKVGSSKINDVESVILHILSIAYYFYNLLPLSKGSSAVAYSVMLGLLMSIGRQITGRIPNGRLLDLEAMLAGAPDAFVLVAKRWMAIKKTTVPVSTLPRVWEVLPTVRSVLEVLSINSTMC
ncbi:tetratricopeptide repeat protein 13-like [Plakobranchus ocellatus]|uniref:Tetratricopeptide repeat protein 13-like n=1 Tax=Plakobranchus ocellatus TaxID=259542 RepID=A0AAV4B9D1_9GAST|nr:tetratricopeptide repeat protein 13-like [Plakobranchus ocellatus]